MCNYTISSLYLLFDIYSKQMSYYYNKPYFFPNILKSPRIWKLDLLVMIRICLQFLLYIFSKIYLFDSVRPEGQKWINICRPEISIILKKKNDIRISSAVFISWNSFCGGKYDLVTHNKYCKVNYKKYNSLKYIDFTLFYT